MTASVRVERAAPEHGAALAELFASSQTGCHCQWWGFAGDKNAWQLRCAEDSANRAAFQQQLRAGEATGFVALAAERAIGWLKLAPAPTLPKLYEQRLYRGLPCFTGDRSGVLTVGCLLVAEEWRRKGVARALLGQAIAWARDSGARSIEAFPRRAEHLRAADLWLGPHALYQELGFVEVHAFAPYPVLRLELAP